MNRWGPILVAGLGSALLLILTSEIHDAISWFDQATPTVEAMSDADAQDKDGAARVVPPSADIGAILARPLFNWNRRPAPDAGVAVDGPLPRLSGILVSASERYAIFATQPGGKSQVVPEGGTIGRFTIDTIASDHVVLRGGADLQTLRPSFNVAPPPPMATPDAS